MLQSKHTSFSIKTLLNKMSSTLTITPQQILDNRQARKDAGLVGCITGRPAPRMDLFGYGDVQIWNRDASGRLNGDPDFNRRDPWCFCFDCRGAFDPRGIVDAEIVSEGHVRAREVYAQLLPADMRPAPRPEPTPSSVLPMRSNGGGIDMLCSDTRGVSLCPDDTDQGHELSPYTDDTAEPTPGPGRVPLLGVNTEQRRYGSFSEVPTSLPAPRARDIMNESPAERLRGDLAILRGQVQSDLVVAMDRARHAVCYDDDDARSAFMASVRADERALHDKLAAIDLLLRGF